MELMASALAILACVSVIAITANPASKHKLIRIPMILCLAAAVFYALEFRLMHKRSKFWQQLKSTLNMPSHPNLMSGA
jgi:hypothetical protein